MISFWVTVVIVCVFSVLVVWVISQHERNDEQQDKSKSTDKLLILFPCLFILAAPVIYYFGGSYQQQMAWNQVVAKVEQLKNDPDPRQVEMSIQELVLGLRTQAFQNPDSGQLWFDIGQVYMGVEMREAAIASLERAMRLNDNPDWKVVTAQLLAAGNDEQQMFQSLRLLQQALITNPEHQSGLLTLGFTHYRMKNYQQAIAAWQKLAAIDDLSAKSRQFVENQIQQAKNQLMPSAEG